MREDITEPNLDNSVGRLVARNQKLTALLDVAKALIEQRSIDPLLDLIMEESKKTVDAERCTLFLMARDGRELWSKIAHGLEGVRVIRLPVGQGIAGEVAKTGEPLNIPDAYQDPRFNRRIDVATGFVTRSILCVPMLGRDRRVVGVVQALNHVGGPFTAADEELLLALGAIAAAAIENASLYEEIERLFEGFVTASVTAIEARDPTTSGHSERVATMSVLCLELLPQAGPAFAHVLARPRELRELRYAALLHDFGKVGVREHVLVKADKLYPHQLELIRARFGKARLEAELEFLRARSGLLERVGARAAQAELARLESAWRTRDEELAAMLQFVERANRPTVLESGGLERIDAMSTMLAEDERMNLMIPRGSLNEKERKEIESHVVHTHNFLRQIPWTRELARVPDIAGTHHEKLDGTGYPRGLRGADIPVEARIMTIVDIYDALTAADRPYKSALPHGKALEILEAEASRQKIDRAILQVFVEADVPGRATALRNAGRFDGDATVELRPILR